MRRVIFFALITLAVFSCTYGGGKSESGNTDSAEMNSDGTNKALSSDTDELHRQQSNDRIKIETN